MKKIITLAAAVLASAGLFAANQVVELPSPVRDGDSDIYTYSLESELSIKKVDALWIEIPSDTISDTIQIKGTGNKDDRFLYIHENHGTTKSATRRVVFSTTYQKLGFTKDDIKTEEGKHYLVFSTGDDFKIKTEFAKLVLPAGACVPPSIVWAVEPENGEVGGADFVASVTTTPAEYPVVWTSSNEEVATVDNGTIHYAATGTTKITASFTYEGEDYCPITVSVSKDIFVPIVHITPKANDRLWYYVDSIPASKPDNGLVFAETTSSNGLYGVKLNSSGYAWFVKPAVAGKLRVGAFYKDAKAAAYEVNIFACDTEGVAQGDALGTLSIAAAGVASAQMDIDKEVVGIRIVRKTSSEGILYFIEFDGEDEPTAIDNIEAGQIVKTIENGQLVIIKNGVRYNAQGVELR
jgi:hypothetical protein